MSSNPDAGVPDERTGILFAGSAYVLWGVLPLYWHALDGVPPFQVTAYRVLFCAALLVVITLARGRFSRFLSVLRTPAVLRNLMLTAALIAINWTIYVYSVATNRIVEASLGYYILPLISIALGVVLFGERLSRVRILALTLAVVAVGVQAVAFGQLPWIALGLAFTFGFYGVFRKATPVDPLDGLLVETGLLFPVAAAAVAWWSASGVAGFSAASLGRDALLMAAGPVTAVPLVLFAAGARRIRLSTLGFLQYLAPTLMLLVATLVYGEPFTLIDGITFVCLWSALVIVALEGQMTRVRLRGMAGK